jgi:hypothetical protein
VVGLRREGAGSLEGTVSRLGWRVVDMPKCEAVATSRQSAATRAARWLADLVSFFTL